MSNEQQHSKRTGTDRRGFLTGGAALAAGALFSPANNQAQGSTQPAQGRPVPNQGEFPVKAISSANGREATRIAYELLTKGKDTLDACVAGVTVVENDPNDTSVGYGGLPNEEGVVELDSAVMHGPSHSCGGVASIRNIKNPAQVARLVMKTTDHVLLVGEGAKRFAIANGFKEENLLTERARKAWLRWKHSLSRSDDWVGEMGAEDPDITAAFNGRPTGTIHCAGINSSGDISCCTTTSGLAWKIPGRVGDSPIIGAGLFCDNDIGSCGSTGRGEANLKNLCSFAAVELMRNGMSPEEAGLEVLKRVADNTPDRLRDSNGRPNFGLNFYLLSKDGRHAGVTMWGPGRFAITDKDGTRHERSAALYERRAAPRR
ncbi:MAG: N(4)-(beta-N-acetylglucosaminyl)-L-asparaginase [Pirellulales bacterium]|nr:N(4)-(beta-N-acetylglucosaminyl)-L-asparaginase [Pirellulales bacterium]